MDFNQHLQTLFGQLKTFFRTETVVGEPIEVGDITLIPLIEISFGLGSGGGTSKDKKADGAAGAGVGAKIMPTAIMVVKEEEVSLIPLKERDSWENILKMAPGLISKLKGKGRGEKKGDPQTE